MENQMEKDMANEMDTGRCRLLLYARYIAEPNTT